MCTCTSDPIREAVQLKPISIAPRRATLLNTGKPLEFAVDMVPSDHIEHKPYLRIRNLPVDEMADTVLVVKLEFDRLPASEISAR